MAADAMVEDVNYTMITDVQIAERTKATVTTDNVAALRQGTSGAKIQTSTETGNQHKYQTRVVSNANKVNLKFEEAKPVLEDQLPNQSQIFSEPRQEADLTGLLADASRCSLSNPGM